MEKKLQHKTKVLSTTFRLVLYCQSPEKLMDPRGLYLYGLGNWKQGIVLSRRSQQRKECLQFFDLDLCRGWKAVAEWSGHQPGILRVKGLNPGGSSQGFKP